MGIISDINFLNIFACSQHSFMYGSSQSINTTVRRSKRIVKRIIILPDGTRKEVEEEIDEYGAPVASAELTGIRIWLNDINHEKI